MDLHDVFAYQIQSREARERERRTERAGEPKDRVRVERRRGRIERRDEREGSCIACPSWPCRKGKPKGEMRRRVRVTSATLIRCGTLSSLLALEFSTGLPVTAGHLYVARSQGISSRVWCSCLFAGCLFVNVSGCLLSPSFADETQRHRLAKDDVWTASKVFHNGMSEYSEWLNDKLN